MGKHVIFLGAGASASSGYPLANRLTLLMTDVRTREAELSRRFSEQLYTDANRGYLQRFQGFEAEASVFLREGCFETMDALGHFCSGRGRVDLIPNLKRLMRFCLSIHNPLEENYGSSDYRAFVQALLRENPEAPDTDVAVLSFNYDPLLDYLLYLAVWQRSNLKVSDKPLRPESSLACSVTSGFSKLNSLNWLNDNGFCHLKLHGVIAPPPPDFIGRRIRSPVQAGDTMRFNSWDILGPLPCEKRLFELTREPFRQTEPPVFLPWEILDPNGNIRGKEDFNATLGQDQWQLHPYYDLIRGVWERARREVQQATKVSFVGLSMNALLKPAVQYLFTGRKDGFVLVVVNKDFSRWNGPDTKRFHPLSSTGRTTDLLRGILGDQFETLKSDRDSVAPTNIKNFSSNGRHWVATQECTQYETFAEFIECELG